MCVCVCVCAIKAYFLSLFLCNTMPREFTLLMFQLRLPLALS